MRLRVTVNHGECGVDQGQIRDMVMISERPARWRTGPWPVTGRVTSSSERR